MAPKKLTLPAFERKKKINPLDGITIIKCRACKKKFATYGRSVLCSNCEK